MRLAWLLLLVTFLLVLPAHAQVLPPSPGGGTGSGTLPETLCVNEVATGLYSTGVLRCAPLTPGMAPGLVPSGGDVSATGQVLSTHLSAPLPLAQGGLGLGSGVSGGIPYFSGPETVSSTANLPLNAPILGGGLGQAPVPGTLSGTTRELASVLGPHIPGKQLTFDANGNVVASPSDVGSGPGGLPVPLPVALGGTGLTTGSAGGVLYFPTADTLASGPAYPLNAPLFGGGPGAAPLAGSLSGTTRTLASVLGPPTPQKQLTFDANGNVIASLVDVGALAPSPLTVPQGGTGLAGGTTGGLLYFSASTALSASPAYAVNVPLLGGGPGQPPHGGLLAGTTQVLATVQGLATPGKQLGFDAQGNVVASAFDLGTASLGVLSVFTRQGAITAEAGDYSADLITNAADLTRANVFTHLAGQSMRALILPGQVSGTLTLRAGGAAGASLLVFPAGTTDFSSTGGPSAVVRQSSAGGPFTVAPLTLADVSGGATACTSASICPGYQASLGFTAENVANKDPSPTLGTSATLYPTQNAVKVYVDTALATKQATLGFAPEDVANKSLTPTLGTSDLLYPTQHAVKSYVDTTLTGLQPTITWGAGLAFTGSTATVASTTPDFLTSGTTNLSAGVGRRGTMQVLASGELQYTDGATTSVLHTGLLTQAGLAWNVTPSICLSDPNGGKLTVTAGGQIQCAADIGGGAGGGSAVTSVFGRVGAVTGQVGDYAASQVTNAADLTTANVFPHVSGQSMRQVVLPGATSGSLTLKPPDAAGSSILTFPAGTTNFTATGGASQVVRQNSAGGPLTVGTLAFADLTGTSTVCLVGGSCAGYQATVTWGAGLTSTGTTASVASSEPGFLTPGSTDLPAGAGQAGSMQVLTTGQLQYVDSAPTPARHTGYVTNPIGTPGTLQTASGSHDLAAFAGRSCPTSTFATAIQPDGSLACDAVPVLSSTAQPLLAQPSPDVPLGINLGALPAGVLATTVISGVASLRTLAAPVGALLGTTDAQEVDNKRINARMVPTDPVAGVLTLNLNTLDGSTSELTGATLIANPLGTAKPGQLLRLQLHSGSPQPLTWDTLWSAELGVPLPTQTTGSTTYDVVWVQYNAVTGNIDVVHNSQLAARVAPSGVVAGTYTCPTAQTVDTYGRTTAITGGPCGGGGGGGATAAGNAGDIQFKAGTTLGADATFNYDAASHTLSVQNIQTSPGGSVYSYRSPEGYVGALLPPPLMTASRTQTLPNESGELCIKGGSCFTGLTGGAAISGTPTTGQTAEWTNATTIQGVNITGSGNYVKATNPALTAPNLGTPSAAILTNATGLPLTTGVTGNLPVANLGGGTSASATTYWRGDGSWSDPTGGVQTLSSSTTYTCPKVGPLTSCKMTMAGSASTVTISTSGTLADGDRFLLRLRCTVAAQAIAYSGTIINSAAVSGPTTCPLDATKEVLIGLIYSSDTAKLQVIASTN